MQLRGKDVGQKDNDHNSVVAFLCGDLAHFVQPFLKIGDVAQRLLRLVPFGNNEQQKDGDDRQRPCLLYTSSAA